MPGTTGIVPTLECHLEKLLQQALQQTRMLNNQVSVVARFSEVWVPVGREYDFLEAYRRLWPVKEWCLMSAPHPDEYMEQARQKVALAFPQHILVSQRWTAAPQAITCCFEDEQSSRGSKKTNQKRLKRQKEGSAIWREVVGQ